MLNYIQTIEVLTEAYEDCINYWKGQRKPIADAKRLARKDIAGMTADPFSPSGKQLNEEAKEAFLKIINIGCNNKIRGG